MGMKEALEKNLADLEAAHEKNRAEYRAALKASAEADARVRQACETASISANELGAAKKAMEELNRNSPAVEASGNMEA